VNVGKNPTTRLTLNLIRPMLGVHIVDHREELCFSLSVLIAQILFRADDPASVAILGEIKLFGLNRLLDPRAPPTPLSFRIYHRPIGRPYLIRTASWTSMSASVSSAVVFTISLWMPVETQPRPSAPTR
jgi:hypothetical protein